MTIPSHLINQRNNFGIRRERINKRFGVNLMSFAFKSYYHAFLFHAAKIKRFLKIKQYFSINKISCLSATADEVFEWWISNESANKYFQNLRFQRKIEFKDE